MDTDPNHISRLETAKDWPSVQTVISACKVLEISADWLLMGIGDGPLAHHPPPTRQKFELVRMRQSTTPPKPTPNKPGKHSAPPKRPLPVAVAAFIAKEGKLIPPEIRELLLAADYDELEMRNATIGQIRQFAKALAVDPDEDDA